MKESRLLIVEDEGIIAADLAARLEHLDYVVVGTAASADEALAIARSQRPDLVLMDIVLQGPLTGIGAAKLIQDSLDIPIVFVTSHADPATVNRAVGATPFGYVVKPFNERELQATIEIGLYRHRVESQLRKMERWLMTTLSSIADAVIATDTAGRIRIFNPVAERLTGWSADNALGQPLEIVLHVVNAATRAPLAGIVDRALQEGFAITMDEHLVLLTRDGPELPIDDSIAPIRDEHGVAIGVVVVFRDASARRLAQHALQQAVESAERQVKQRDAALASANRMLGAFSASVMNDLRVPVLAVMGLSAMLADRYEKVLDADGRNFLDLLAAKSKQMDALIDGYLGVARVRQIPLRAEPIDMHAMVRDLVTTFAATNPRARHITVDALPPATGDAAMFRQVWSTLLGNALRFSAGTDEPRIHVHATVDSVDGIKMNRFWTRDNGVGFDPQRAARLFEVFQPQPPDRADTGTGGGRGMGLAIVQSVVERHGGRVHAEGTPGQGAVFSFWLPQVSLESADTPARTPNIPSSPGRKAHR